MSSQPNLNMSAPPQQQQQNNNNMSTNNNSNNNNNNNNNGQLLYQQNPPSTQQQMYQQQFLQQQQQQYLQQQQQHQQQQYMQMYQQGNQPQPNLMQQQFLQQQLQQQYQQQQQQPTSAAAAAAVAAAAAAAAAAVAAGAGPAGEDESEKKGSVKRRPKLKCATCETVLKDDIMVHDELHLPLCEQCGKAIAEEQLTVNSSGIHEKCTLCRLTGDLLVCSRCPRGICNVCVKRNLGDHEVKRIEDDPNWACYVCDPTPIRSIQQKVDEYINRSKTPGSNKKKKKTEKTWNGCPMRNLQQGVHY